MNFCDHPYVKLIVCEGLIGAGKTSLLEAFVQEHHSRFHLELIPEGLYNFNKSGSYNPLELSYEDPEKNFGICQIHIIRVINDLFNRAIYHFRRKYLGVNTPTQKKPLIILADRSLFSPLVFAANAHANGVISSFVSDFLSQEAFYLAGQSYRRANIFVRGVFYLDVEPAECLNRCNKRGRSYETGLTEEYLTDLREQYMEHLAWWRLNMAVKVCVVPGSNNREAIYERLRAFIEDIIKEDRLCQ